MNIATFTNPLFPNSEESKTIIIEQNNDKTSINRHRYFNKIEK